MWPFAENAITLIVPLVWGRLLRAEFADEVSRRQESGASTAGYVEVWVPFAAFAFFGSVSSASQLGNVLYVMALGIARHFCSDFCYGRRRCRALRRFHAFLGACR